ncbi:putative N-acetyltransferase [Pseudohongiella nitratireducens]|jgi:ribosomal protein S18 acetylase RimI-like enzyme|uniref:N-acetyltransferase n=1 Tax=Pseudohongiella nitratireducens TaxID=1768907 RepID=A0A916QLX4_9GAMM|nr:GNAT family acetyltransferase [Pseudohongiella nitratireducens]GFZ83034.1 putative N-acetyltransferase [Pseudohongiella nitratireducens]
MKIRQFDKKDIASVISLWEQCGLTRPWNNPQQDIARKLTVQPELFVVGEVDGQIMASAMAGYDGHRGSVYYLAVSPDYQESGYGRKIMAWIEQTLLEMGCPKLNIVVRSSNKNVLRFYDALGYVTDDVISLGKRIIPDQ